MKTLNRLFILLALSLCHAAFAQEYDVQISATMLKDYKGLKKGTEVQITKVEHEFKKTESASAYAEPSYRDSYNLIINDMLFPMTDKMSDRFDFHPKSTTELWDAQMICNVLNPLQENGTQSRLRTEMEEDALEYISKVKQYGAEFKDPYLENYIYGLIAKIVPTELIDGRPYNVNILLLSDPDLNMGIYPNGTMIINTGLLACLHSEDELVAVLSHEIAHFVLDHQVQNVNKATARKKRAEFWGAVLTGVTAVAEGVAAAKSDYYVPGLATLGVAALSSGIAEQVIDRLGMKYNHNQETKADQLALEVLSLLGYDKNALATAFNRIQETMAADRRYTMYFDSYTHPALMERLKKVGEPQQTSDPQFERIISFAVSNAAMLKFANRRFKQVLPFVSQNIANGVGTVDDYLIKARCLLALYDTPESNIEVATLINSAKEADPKNINIYKIDILSRLRMGKQQEAMVLLNEYEDKLKACRVNSDMLTFINSEIGWCTDMKIKLRGM